MPGETIGIIGGTGSGKSTLVSLIPRFYDPQDGQVYMDGENVTEYTRKSIGEKVGIVQQRSVLFQGSIRDNLKWSDENATDEDIWKAIEIAQAKEVLKESLESWISSWSRMDVICLVDRNSEFRLHAQF